MPRSPLLRVLCPHPTASVPPCISFSKLSAGTYGEDATPAEPLLFETEEGRPGWDFQDVSLRSPTRKDGDISFASMARSGLDEELGAAVAALRDENAQLTERLRGLEVVGDILTAFYICKWLISRSSKTSFEGRRLSLTSQLQRLAERSRSLGGQGGPGSPSCKREVFAASCAPAGESNIDTSEALSEFILYDR